MNRFYLKNSKKAFYTFVLSLSWWGASPAPARVASASVPRAGGKKLWCLSKLFEILILPAPPCPPTSPRPTSLG